MSIPILATKLYSPTPRPTIVYRSRLLERLNEGLYQDQGFGRKLTLISAPAGFGKTTLLSSWINSKTEGVGVKAETARRFQPSKVAWLSLDEKDKDLGRFLIYLIAALQTLDLNVAEGVTPQETVKKIGEGVLAALQSPQPPPTEVLLTALLNELAALAEPCVLVLDDYHALDAPPVDAALAFLLDHLPPQLHLVIASREDPNLPLARLRARGQLTELLAADLRFTPAEAAEFLNRVMALNLSADNVTALENRTEGWIAGLQLAAISMRGQADPTAFIQSFTGSHRFVLDYLLEEVLHRQPEHIQTFLLQTAILDRLCGPLCDAVLKDERQPSADILQTLERANLFLVPLDDERHWYRYHHLFGDLLRKELRRRQPSEAITALHLRASAWYEHNGMAFEAFHHATLADDVARAERLIGSQDMRLHLRSVTAPILAWLAALPKDVLDAHPKLWVRSATLALMAGQTTGVEERLQSAEKALESASPNDATRDLFGQIACARATLALTRYDPEAMLVQAHRALEHLHPDNLAFRFTANWALASASLLQGDRATAARACEAGIAISQQSGDMFSRILALSDLGQIRELENQLYQAAACYRQVLELSGEHPHPNVGEVYLGLARIHYEWNELDAAETYAQESLRLTRQFDQAIDRFILSDVFLARLQLARGDVDAAATTLAQAEETARQKDFTLRLPDVAAAQVRVLLRQGNLPAAAHLAHKYELPLSQASVLLAQGETAAALALLTALRQQLEAKAWQDERLKTLILQALAFQGHGDTEIALQTLDEALTLAEPGGFIRLFVDKGEPMAQLLSEARAQGIAPDYTGKLLAAFPDFAATSTATSHDLKPVVSETNPADMLEPLTPREMDVLRLIAQGLSNREIGERLFLALDTVKGHNRRIYGKLHVRRRTEAVARARELGLL